MARRRARQSCCGALILLVLVSVPVSVAFGIDGKPPASRKTPAASVVSRTGQLTVEATEERLRDVLDRISRATGVKFHVEESLPDSAVTISLNNVPIEAGLKRLLGRDFDLVWAYDHAPGTSAEQSRVAEVWVLAKGSPGMAAALREAGKAPKSFVDTQMHVSERLAAISDMASEDPAKVRKALIGMLNDPDSEVRIAAIDALAQVDGARAIEPLARLLKTDKDADVRRTITEALADMESPAAIPALQHALNSDTDAEIRQTAAQALGDLESPAAIPGLGQALKDPDADIRQTAIESLAKIGGVEAMRTLRRALNDENEDVREAAADALADLSNNN